MKAYTEEFKMIELYNAGKAPTEIVREYGMARSALSKWISKYNNIGSFKAGSLNYREKIAVIKANKHKYSIIRMRKILNISRKIKKVIVSAVSRKKIGTIMAKYNLVSKYTLKCYKHHKTTVNNAKITNVLNREFNRKESLDVILSDLTIVLTTTFVLLSPYVFPSFMCKYIPVYHLPI